MKRKTLFILAVSITILHFIVTSVTGHYIAVQIGTTTGQAVAKGLAETTDKEKEANEIYQDMKSEKDEAISKWKIPLLLISLPIKPVIQPLLNKIRKAWIYEPAFSKRISKDQFKRRGLIIDNAATSLNSLAFGLLIYFAYRLLRGRSASSK